MIEAQYRLSFSVILLVYIKCPLMFLFLCHFSSFRKLSHLLYFQQNPLWSTQWICKDTLTGIWHGVSIYLIILNPYLTRFLQLYIKSFKHTANKEQKTVSLLARHYSTLTSEKNNRYPVDETKQMKNFTCLLDFYTVSALFCQTGERGGKWSVGNTFLQIIAKRKE